MTNGDCGFSVRPTLPPFTWVPQELMQAKLLTPPELAVLLAIGCHGEECFPSHERLAEFSNTSLATVKRSLGKLKKFGIVSWEKRHGPQGQTSNLYELHLTGKPQGWWLRLSATDKPIAHAEPHPSSERASPQLTVSDEKESITRIKEKELERTSSTASNPAPTPQKKDRKNKHKLIEQWLDETPDQFKQHRAKLKKWLEVRWDKKPRYRDSPWSDGCKSIQGLTYATENGVVEEFLDSSFADNAGWISFGFPGFVDCVQRLARDKQRLNGNAPQQQRPLPPGIQDLSELVGGVRKADLLYHCADLKDQRGNTFKELRLQDIHWQHIQTIDEQINSGEFSLAVKPGFEERVQLRFEHARRTKQQKLEMELAR